MPRLFILLGRGDRHGGDGGSSSGVDGASSSGSSSSSAPQGLNDGGNEAGAGVLRAREVAVLRPLDDANPGQMWTAQAEHGRFIETTFASVARVRAGVSRSGRRGRRLPRKEPAFPADANLRLEVAIRLTTDDDVYPVGLFFRTITGSSSTSTGS